jgi:hypothetical protein
MLSGFVKFFSSYYIILVETASEVGTIAGHHIYTLREAPALIQVNTQLSDPRYVRFHIHAFLLLNFCTFIDSHV